jgi:hypothetical protein
MEHAVHHPILAALFQLMTLRLDQPNQQHLTFEALQFGFGDAGHRVLSKKLSTGKSKQLDGNIPLIVVFTTSSSKTWRMLMAVLLQILSTTAMSIPSEEREFFSLAWANALPAFAKNTASRKPNWLNGWACPSRPSKPMSPVNDVFR